jgi:NADH dehydrogenase (ubiquinone) 1 alpha subcomplex subunit 5
VQAITQHRKTLVETTQDERQLEQLLGVPRIELALAEAHDELALMESMDGWKAWEELEEPIPRGQWEGFQNKIQ